MSADDSSDDRTQSFVALTAGTRVSHYRIIEKIGAGGMGEVYLAEDKELDRKVALKFLPSHLCQDEDCRRRFKREAQAAAKLSHPNIVHVYEVSEYHGRPFFVMEHVEGRSLRDITAEELDIDRIIGIAIQLCDGLQSAHASGVIHRDVKPSNIILDSSGRPKLLDFGLAAVKGGEDLTKTGSTLGTIGYMSPEQIEGKTTDARSDLFSLGVVLYELIAYKSPFRRDDQTATLKAILQDTPQPLARYNSSVPDNLQRIISKLLEKDPSLRYQSAAGVIPDLKKLSAASSASMATERKRDRWNRYVVPSAVVILLAVVAIWYFGYRDKEPATAGADDRIRLAVLPFDNLGDPEDEYFADGMTEEIIGKLAGLSGLGVISRTSSMRYKGTNKSLGQIGEDLGVEYVLEGTVRWTRSSNGSRIRVQPQLIRVADDVHIWTDSYDGILEDVLALQSRIALSIADALGLSLISSEKDKLGNLAAIDPEAYRLFIQGSKPPSFSFEDRRKAINLLSQAVELAPDFARAQAALSLAMVFYFRDFGETGLGHITEARAHAERAISLAPQIADGYIALSDYALWVDDNREQALAHLESALSVEPNNTDALESMGMLMFLEGNFQASHHFYMKAIAYDPVHPITMYANLLLWQRKWDELIEYSDAVLAGDPGNHIFLMRRAEALGEKYLSVDSVTANMPPRYDTLVAEDWSFVQGAYVAMLDRDYEMAESMCQARRREDKAGIDSAYTNLSLAWIQNLRDPSLVNRYADSAIVGFERFLNGDSISAFMEGVASVYLALSYAFDGDSLRADSICRMVLDNVPLNDQTSLSTILNMCAITFATIGQEDDAIDILEGLLSRPSNLSIFSLKYWPMLDPLRDNPRFQALVEKYEKQHGT
jgi:TolB-like protein/predicted Ser/Thr protein kinase